MLTANATETEKLKPIVIGSFIEPYALAYEESNSEKEELESVNSDNKESHASLSRNFIRCGHGCLRLNASNINKQSCARPYRLSAPSETSLTNIRLEFLPPHTTAHLQPMDAEVETSTIVNCWVKTGILPALSGNEIESATLALQDLAYFEKDENDELIVDLTTNLLDPTIEREINNFNNLNNSQILTEDVLDEMQIVHIVLDEQENMKKVTQVTQIMNHPKFLS
ncbi:19497_t:CDS:2 [Racocetra fulgida]|uniref:19497_t:CDS:1 n=1 Tax=Racocetra fulgida TaxID=60492 RepID=A0A9N9CQL2_9GLOM|nr:19497_t:CDS:2 [Racocetra fulgida]